jgi:hypothetical protein
MWQQKQLFRLKHNRTNITITSYDTGTSEAVLWGSRKIYYFASSVSPTALPDVSSLFDAPRSVSSNGVGLPEMFFFYLTKEIGFQCRRFFLARVGG